MRESLNKEMKKNITITLLYNNSKIVILSILQLFLIYTNIYADTIPNCKLLVDNGRFQESEWVRQLAITADDKFLLVSDFSNGVRIYEVETGELINSFEGHSLEGDAYFDKKNNLLVTTGDKKIKIWDIARQSLMKQINQGFHSQFMNNVYIDSKKKVLYAEKIKYDYNSKAVLKKYAYDNMYFFEDAYYIFTPLNGILKGYSVYDDKLISTYRIENYAKGYNVFFNENKGMLFIGYSDGIVSVDITSGKSETILFDRQFTFDNLSICSNSDFSYDKSYFISSSNQGEDNRRGGHFVVVKKNKSTGKYEEIVRTTDKADEIVALNKSNRCIVSIANTIQLFDLDKLQPIWVKKEELQKINNIYLNKDPEYLNLKCGIQYIHLLDIKLASGSSYNTGFVENYFDLINGANIENTYGFASFKSNLKETEIPDELRSLWRNSKQYFLLSLVNNLKINPVTGNSNIFFSGSEKDEFGTITGKVYSPGKQIYATEKSFTGVSFYRNETKLLTAPTSGVIYHIEYSKDEKYAAFGGSDRMITVVDLVQKKKLYSLNGNSYVTTICFSKDNKYVFSGSLKNEILLHDVLSGKLIRKFNGSNGSILDLEVSSNNKMLISVADDNALRFWDINSGNLLLTAYYDYNFNYIAFTPDGYFDKSEKFDASISWNTNGSVIKFDQLFETYYRPDIIKSILIGDNVIEKKITSVENGIKTPPAISLQVTNRGTTQSGMNEKTANVIVSAKNTGGGIRGMRLFNNNKLVGEKFLDADASPDTSEVTKDFKVDLINGNNKIRAIGFSKDMTESKGSVVDLVYKEPAVSKPTMFVIAIGINEYKNNRYNLNYCVADMQGFSEKLSSVGNSLFKEVYVKKIQDNEATKENILKAFDEFSGKITPSDVFTLFYAGHGIALDKFVNSSNISTDFYYVLNGVTQMTDIEKCSANGISGTEMRGLLTKIKANKQLLFIDACNSGAFAEQFKSRGAAEENALAKLSRATGSIVFASTTKEQNATEFDELKHGVFTYVLMDALNGEASLSNCQITVASIKSFIDDKIPFYTEKYTRQSQYPTTFMWGQDFPIGIKCKGQ